MEVSLVRTNLMNQQYYTPYCGNELPRNHSSGCDNPRTRFDGSQFVCPKCNFKTDFPDDFINRYKEKWNL